MAIDVYGRSPAMDLLPDLQRMQERLYANSGRALSARATIPHGSGPTLPQDLAPANDKSRRAKGAKPGDAAGLVPLRSRKPVAAPRVIPSMPLTALRHDWSGPGFNGLA